MKTKNILIIISLVKLAQNSIPASIKLQSVIFSETVESMILILAQKINKNYTGALNINITVFTSNFFY
jgi:hypothetical protein